MGEQEEPPREVWLRVARLAKVPADQVESCASELESAWDATAGSWPPPLPQMLPPRAALLRGLRASQERAIAAIEALGPSELQALAVTLGQDPREFPAWLKKYAAFGAALADAAHDIVPSANGGRGRPPARIRRRISDAEAAERLEPIDAIVRDTDGRHAAVISVGEALLAGLAQAALEHDGAFSFDRKGAMRGTIVQAWGLLKPYMPPGAELPKPRRIQDLLKKTRAGFT